MTVALDATLELHPHVALRPEPFGALAYHYDTRRLVFLRSPDVLSVVRALRNHSTVEDALVACGIAPARWPAFLHALDSLSASEVVRGR
jgi:putative mycofactocin binding protein MftB